MIKVIHIFHDVLWAHVELDGSDVLAWVNIYQGFRQGCLLPPLLFNFLFAVIITPCSGFAAVRGGTDDRLGLGVSR